MSRAERIVAEFSRAIDELLPGGWPGTLGVAVSGGSDSTALLLLLHQRAGARGCRLRAVSVDHGLRPEAAAEIGGVARLCRELGVGHDTLRWRAGAGGGNLQDRARRARYRLIADWARERDVGAVALGHTLDDQAETVLMRLARGAGVDGLSAMAPQRRAHGVRWLRPLLGLRRAGLRAWLESRGVGWSEDPSNADMRFARVRMRRALAELAPLGISPEGLAATAARMVQTRAALERQTQEAARALARVRAGAVFLDSAALEALPDEIRRRLLGHALRWVSGADYPPRQRSLDALEAALRDRVRHTLHGCLMLPGRVRHVLSREAAALRALRSRPGEVWDGRWRVIAPPDAAGDPVLEVRLLGEGGLAFCPRWRATGLPRPVLAASPAVWRGAELVAAPLAGAGNGFRAEALRDEAHFVASVLSH